MKLSVIGSGRLGGQIGYVAACRGVVDELVFVDMLTELAEGQAEDVAQALASYCDAKVMSGWENVSGSDICVIAAGKPRTPDIKSRLELTEINKKVVGEVAAEIAKRAPKCVIITVTNPMDVMNYVAYKRSGFPRERVLGFGGLLDGPRFRRVLSLETGEPVTKIEAAVLGEHGDTQVHIFSRVKINGKGRNFSDEQKKKIRERLKGIGLGVIAKKGATIFAPASGVADMIVAIAKDSKEVMPVSAVLEGEYGTGGISMGVPAVLGRNGIEKIEEWKLSAEEESQLKKSAENLKEYIRQIGEI